MSFAAGMCSMAGATAGEAAMHALKHAAASIFSSQQLSGSG
jgi:hypothetical protein